MKRRIPKEPRGRAIKIVNRKRSRKGYKKRNCKGERENQVKLYVRDIQKPTPVKKLS